MLTTHKVTTPAPNAAPAGAQAASTAVSSSATLRQLDVGADALTGQYIVYASDYHNDDNDNHHIVVIQTHNYDFHDDYNYDYDWTTTYGCIAYSYHDRRKLNHDRL